MRVKVFFIFPNVFPKLQLLKSTKTKVKFIFIEIGRSFMLNMKMLIFKMTRKYNQSKLNKNLLCYQNFFPKLNFLFQKQCKNFKSVDTHRDLFGVKQNLALVWYLNTQIQEKRAEKGIEIPILTDVPVTKTKFLESIEMRGNCVFKHSRI